MIDFLSSIPWFINVALIVGFAIGATAFFFYVVRSVIVDNIHPTVGDEQRASNFSLNTLALIYSVFVVLVFIDIQSQHNRIQDSIIKEASILTDMYHTSKAYPFFKTVDIETEIRQYAVNVLETELPLMKSGADYALVPFIHPDHLWNAFSTLNPTDYKQLVLYDSMIRRLEELTDVRFERFTSVDGRTTPFIWTVLIYGALILIACSVMFSSKPKTTSLVLLSFNVSMIVLILLLIYSLDNPFAEPTQVSLKAFNEIIRHSSFAH